MQSSKEVWVGCATKNNKWKAGPFWRFLWIFCGLVGGYLVWAKMAAGGVHFGGGATTLHSLSKHPLLLGRCPQHGAHFPAAFGAGFTARVICAIPILVPI